VLFRSSAKAVQDAHEADEVLEWTDRAGPAAEGFGTLADKFRSALKPREQ
jgi:hypothetical protein